MSRTAVVAGATGLVGGMLLQQLAARAEYGEIRVLGRRAPPLAAVRFFATDFSDLDALGDALAADDVYCCLGTTLRQAGSKAAFERVDYHMVVDLARAAKKAGARQFIVVSAVGASLNSPAFYSRVKARMEQAVGGLGFEATHVVRPSLLLGRRRELRPAERAAQQAAPLLGWLCIGPLRKYRPVAAADVAAAMIALALREQHGTHLHHLPLD